MPLATASALILATPEKAFDFVADYRNIPRMQPQFSSVKLISQLERGQGSIIEMSGRFHGMPMRVKNRIVTYSPPRRLVSVSDGTVLSRNVWEFESIDKEVATTRVSLSIEYKVVAGPLGKLFTGVASSLFHKEIQDMADESLRRLGTLLSEEYHV